MSTAMGVTLNTRCKCLSKQSGPRKLHRLVILKNSLRRLHRPVLKQVSTSACRVPCHEMLSLKIKSKDEMPNWTMTGWGGALPKFTLTCGSSRMELGFMEALDRLQAPHWCEQGGRISSFGPPGVLRKPNYTKITLHQFLYPWYKRWIQGK